MSLLYRMPSKVHNGYKYLSLLLRHGPRARACHTFQL